MIITILAMTFSVALMGWEAIRFLREYKRDRDAWAQPQWRPEEKD